MSKNEPVRAYQNSPGGLRDPHGGSRVINITEVKING